MIRRMLATAAILAALATTGTAMAGSIDVCTNTGSGPANSGGVTVSESGVTVSWGAGAGGSGGAQQCLHINHP